MSSQSPTKAQLWGGRVVSALPVLMLAMSATMKLMHGDQVMAHFVGKFGYPERAIMPIAVVELLSAILYAIPQTSVLGAVLVTGFLGGAVATHARVGEPFIGPLALGVLAWVGLFLRDERVRALLPLRKL